MDLTSAIITGAVSGIGGGLIGAFVTGLRMGAKVGSWRRGVESEVELLKQTRAADKTEAENGRRRLHEDVEAIYKRLEKGSDMLGEVPKLSRELKLFTEELKLTRQSVARLVEEKLPGLATKEDLKDAVAGREKVCDARHPGRRAR